MELSSSDSEPLKGGWTTLLRRVYEDPQVAQVMRTRLAQYLVTHPFLALAVALFCAMAAVPVGLFLIFALVTTVMAVVGFVFFEAFLLFTGGFTLLCVLSGLAFFSVTVSLIFNALHISISNILKYYQQKSKIQEKDTDFQVFT